MHRKLAARRRTALLPKDTIMGVAQVLFEKMELIMGHLHGSSWSRRVKLAILRITVIFSMSVTGFFDILVEVWFGRLI